MEEGEGFDSEDVDDFNGSERTSAKRSKAPEQKDREPMDASRGECNTRAESADSVRSPRDASCKRARTLSPSVLASAKELTLRASALPAPGTLPTFSSIIARPETSGRPRKLLKLHAIDSSASTPSVSAPAMTTRDADSPRLSPSSSEDAKMSQTRMSQESGESSALRSSRTRNEVDPSTEEPSTAFVTNGAEARQPQQHREEPEADGSSTTTSPVKNGVFSIASLVSSSPAPPVSSSPSSDAAAIAATAAEDSSTTSPSAVNSSQDPRTRLAPSDMVADRSEALETAPDGGESIAVAAESERSSATCRSVGASACPPQAAAAAAAASATVAPVEADSSSRSREREVAVTKRPKISTPPAFLASAIPPARSPSPAVEPADEAHKDHAILSNQRIAASASSSSCGTPHTHQSRTSTMSCSTSAESATAVPKASTAEDTPAQMPPGAGASSTADWVHQSGRQVKKEGAYFVTQSNGSSLVPSCMEVKTTGQSLSKAQQRGQSNFVTFNRRRPALPLVHIQPAATIVPSLSTVAVPLSFQSTATVVQQAQVLSNELEKFLRAAAPAVSPKIATAGQRSSPSETQAPTRDRVQVAVAQGNTSDNQPPTAGSPAWAAGTLAPGGPEHMQRSRRDDIGHVGSQRRQAAERAEGKGRDGQETMNHAAQLAANQIGHRGAHEQERTNRAQWVADDGWVVQRRASWGLNPQNNQQVDYPYERGSVANQPQPMAFVAPASSMSWAPFHQQVGHRVGPTASAPAGYHGSSDSEYYYPPHIPPAYPTPAAFAMTQHQALHGFAKPRQDDRLDRVAEQFVLNLQTAPQHQQQRQQKHHAAGNSSRPNAHMPRGHAEQSGGQLSSAGHAETQERSRFGRESGQTGEPRAAATSSHGQKQEEGSSATQEPTAACGVARESAGTKKEPTKAEPPDDHDEERLKMLQKQLRDDRREYDRVRKRLQRARQKKVVAASKSSPATSNVEHPVVTATTTTAATTANTTANTTNTTTNINTNTNTSATTKSGPKHNFVPLSRILNGSCFTLRKAPGGAFICCLRRCNEHWGADRLAKVREGVPEKGIGGRKRRHDFVRASLPEGEVQPVLRAGPDEMKVCWALFMAATGISKHVILSARGKALARTAIPPKRTDDEVARFITTWLSDLASLWQRKTGWNDISMSYPTKLFVYQLFEEAYRAEHSTREAPSYTYFGKVWRRDCGYINLKKDVVPFRGLTDSFWESQRMQPTTKATLTTTTIPPQKESSSSSSAATSATITTPASAIAVVAIESQAEGNNENSVPIKDDPQRPSALRLQRFPSGLTRDQAETASDTEAGGTPTTRGVPHGREEGTPETSGGVPQMQQMAVLSRAQGRQRGVLSYHGGAPESKGGVPEAKGGVPPTQGSVALREESTPQMHEPKPPLFVDVPRIQGQLVPEAGRGGGSDVERGTPPAHEGYLATQNRSAAAHTLAVEAAAPGNPAGQKRRLSHEPDLVNGKRSALFVQTTSSVVETWATTSDPEIRKNGGAGVGYGEGVGGEVFEGGVTAMDDGRGGAGDSGVGTSTVVVERTPRAGNVVQREERKLLGGAESKPEDIGKGKDASAHGGDDTRVGKDEDLARNGHGMEDGEKECGRSQGLIVKDPPPGGAASAGVSPTSTVAGGASTATAERTAVLGGVSEGGENNPGTAGTGRGSEVPEGFVVTAVTADPVTVHRRR